MSDARINLTAEDKTKAAFESVKANLADIQTKAVAVTGVLAGLGIATYVAGIATQVHSAIEQWDELGKAAQRAGMVSAQAMAEFQFAAKLAGVDAGGFEQAVGKLAAKMADAAGGSKEAAATFAALGIKVKDSTGQLRSTESVLTDLAQKFSQFKDSPEKTALALDLFGKAGKALIPLLNGGAEGLEKLRDEFRQLRGTLDDGTVKSAEQFNDNITRLQTSSGALGREMAQTLLPSLVRVTDQMVQAAKEGGFLRSVLAGLQTVLTGDDLHKANVEMAEVADRMLVVENARQKINAKGAANWTGQDAATMRNLDAELASLQERYQRARGYRDMLDGSTAAAAPVENKPAAPVVKKPAAASHEESAYRRVNDSVMERLKLQAQELTAGRELTEVEKFEIKTLDDLQTSKVKVTDAQVADVKVKLENAKAQEKLVLQQRAETKAALENAAAWTKILDTTHASSQKLEEEIRAQNDSNAAIGLGTQALGELEAARLRDKAAAIERRAEIFRDIDFSGETSEALLEEAKRWRELADAKQLGATKQQNLDDFKSTWESIDRTAHDVWVNIFEGGSNVFKKLTQTLKATLLDALYQMTIKRWIVNVVASVTGTPIGAAMNAAGLGSGTYAGGVMNNLGLVGAGYQAATGSFTGASTASLAYANGVGYMGGDSLGALISANGGWAGVGAGGAALGSTAGTTAGAYGLGTLGTGGVGYGATLGGSIMGGATGTTSVAAGSVAAGSTVGGTAAGGTAAGAGAAAGASWIPVVGWVIAAAAVLYAIFGNKGGGPKVDGVYGKLGSGIGQGRRSDETDNAAAQAALGLQKQFDNIVASYGGDSRGLKFGLGYSMDPAGSSPSFLDITGSRDGQIAFSDLNRNAGRSQEELLAAIATTGSKAILKGLQESNLVGSIGEYMRRLGDIDKLSGGAIDAAIAKVQRALTEKQALEDQYWALTHTDAEVLQRNRLREVSALDESNRALAIRIQALQDEKEMQQQIFAVTSNIKAYVDKLDGSPSGLLPPETQLANAKAQYDQQLEKARGGDAAAMQNITGYAEQYAQAQTAFTASGQPTQDTLNYIRQTLNSLPGTIANGGTSLGGAGAQAAGWGWFPEMNAGMSAPVWHYGPIAEMVAKYTGFANGQPMPFNGGNATPTTYQPPVGTKSPDGFQYFGNGVTGLAAFADGAAFVNSVVRRPTTFGMPGGGLGVMGEVAPEAVMPLANVRGGLGVNITGAANDPELRAEVRGLRSDLRNLTLTVAAGARATTEGVDEVARNTAGLNNQALLQKISKVAA